MSQPLWQQIVDQAFEHAAMVPTPGCNTLPKLSVTPADLFAYTDEEHDYEMDGAYLDKNGWEGDWDYTPDHRVGFRGSWFDGNIEVIVSPMGGE